jgi:ABC-2 type transport system permease protein
VSTADQAGGPGLQPGTARIHDRGYRGYTGERTGLRGAIVTLYRFTMARVLGLRRPFRAKALPILVGVLAYLPAVVLIGLTVLLPGLEDKALPSYAEYYGFIIAAIIVFVAFVAPEALCPDRRNKLLGTYLASPLDRDTYLMAKFASVTTLIAGVTLAPPLLLAVARTFQGIGPAPSDLVLLLARIMASGSVLAVFFAAVSLGVSSLTDRKAFASAGMILIVIVSGAVAGAIRGNDPSRDAAGLISVTAAPTELVFRIYGQVGNWPGAATWLVVVATLAWALVPLALLVWRYRTLEVTR